MKGNLKMTNSGKKIDELGMRASYMMIRVLIIPKICTLFIVQHYLITDFIQSLWLTTDPKSYSISMRVGLRDTRG